MRLFENSDVLFYSTPAVFKYCYCWKVLRLSNINWSRR